jgi:ribose-phosphate pyrophosphokinase
VTGKTCVIVDDMADTAGTLCQGVDALITASATGVIAAITHPVLSGKAYENIGKCNGLSHLITTDTIPPRTLREAFGGRSPTPAEMAGSQKLLKVSIAPLLAEAIRRTHNEESISALFK